jgi:DNA-binding SARP family transcriptional activator/TolB-like protein
MGLPATLGLSEKLFFPAKAFQLLAFLVLNRNRKHSRRYLASLLWDSASEEMALANLRQLLARMRRLMPGDELPLVVGKDSVAFRHASCVIDILEFEELMSGSEPGHRLDGLQLYRGELLESIIDTTAQFDEWLAIERSSLREGFYAACSDTFLDLTHYGHAAPSLMKRAERLLLSFDAEREDSYRVLIETYGRLGRFDDANRLYLALKGILEGAAPAAATAAAMRRIMAARVSADQGGLRLVSQTQTPPRVGFLAPSLLHAGQAAPLMRALIEDVANELARYRSFTVLAPHSSMQVDHDSGVPSDNSRLKMDYTIGGFLKSSASGDRLALRLVRLAGAEIVWAGEYALGAAELYPSAWLLTKQIASTIGSSLERSILQQRRTSGDADAYFHYLRGREHQSRCDLPAVRRARREFSLAIEIDRYFSQARARIAETLFVEWILLGGTDGSLLAEARRHAHQSLSDDPGVAIAHWVSGAVSLYQRDFDVVEAYFKQAEALAPNSADLLLEYGDALSHLGEHAAGWEKNLGAVDLNPLPPDRYWWFGASIAFGREDFQTAIDLCGRLNSDEVAVGLRAASYAMAGRKEEARHWARRVREVLPDKTLADFARLSPCKHSRDMEVYLSGLRMAGVS